MFGFSGLSLRLSAGDQADFFVKVFLPVQYPTTGLIGSLCQRH